MTKHTDSTNNVVLVAIDIAKLKHDVLVKHPDGSTQSFKVANHWADFEKFAAFLRAQPHPCRIAFEPTADYHRNIAWRLLTDGHEVKLASSLACARTREGIFNSRDKNDPKDAQVIMHLLETGVVQHYHDPLAHGMLDLQELANTYSVVSHRRAQLLHSLKNHYFTLYFPEIEKYLNSTRSEWFVRTFHRFPTPASISGLSLAEFTEQVSPLVGRKQHKTQWIAELYDTARASIGLPVELDSEAIRLFRMMLNEYGRQTSIRSELEERTEALLSNSADYQILRSIPGVGPIVAMIILAEAGDLRRFAHHRQFLKFCGLDLATYQSGNSRSATRLSKRGNARLRLAFWMAANRAVTLQENTFRQKYERYISIDRNDKDRRRKARTAVAAKVARVAHALVKHQRPYRPYHESVTPGGKIPLARAVEASSTS